MLYIIRWTNRATGDTGQSDIYFSNREHALEICRLSRVDNPWNDYRVMQSNEEAHELVIGDYVIPDSSIRSR